MARAALAEAGETIGPGPNRSDECFGAARRSVTLPDGAVVPVTHRLSVDLHRTLAGVALGTLGSFVLSKWIESLLFGTTPTNPAVFAGVSLLLCAVALAAAYFPARRASRIEPLQALRTE